MDWFDDAAMPCTDFSSSAVAFASLGRSMPLSTASPANPTKMESGAAAKQQDTQLLDFQHCVADLFLDLADADGFLSVAWLRRLLDAFLLCQADFRFLLLDRCANVACPHLCRLLDAYADRAIKALDICNAARNGIEELRRWRVHLDIVIAALRPAGAINEGQLRRARKALTDLAVLMLDGRDAGGEAIAQRNRSFGRSARSTSRASNLRSHSWSVTRSWSLARLLQAIGSNVAAPRVQEVTATGGLAVPIYTMSTVLLFTMSSLVAAIPCQDRGPLENFPAPRGFPWAAPIASLHERITEESKTKRKGAVGLLKEIQQIERCAHQLTGLVETVKLPMSEVEETELRQKADDLAQICEALKEELDPLERQVREVFLRIVRGRIDGFNHSAIVQREANN